MIDIIECLGLDVTDGVDKALARRRKAQLKKVYSYLSKLETAKELDHDLAYRLKSKVTEQFRLISEVNNEND